jgi:chorismate mutase
MNIKGMVQQKYQRGLLWGLMGLVGIWSWQASASSVGELINQRLSWMKEVAAWKAVNHLPVEDLVQEKRVLDSTLAEAQQLGLAPDTVSPFIRAQMDVAKAIQYRYRADWLSQPDQVTPPRSLNETRTQINRISNATLRQLSSDLRTDPQAAVKICSSVQNIQLQHLTTDDKNYLCRTLQQIKMQSR